MATAPDLELIEAGEENIPLNAFFASHPLVAAGYALASATVAIHPAPGADVTVETPTISGTTAQALFTADDDADEATYQVKWEGTFTKAGQDNAVGVIRGRLYVRADPAGA